MSCWRFLPPPRPPVFVSLQRPPCLFRESLANQVFFVGATRDALLPCCTRLPRLHCCCPPPFPPPLPSRLVYAMSSWSVKTRRGFSCHFTGARVYDHTTTAMHETNPPRPPFCLHLDYPGVCYCVLWFCLFLFRESCETCPPHLRLWCCMSTIFIRGCIFFP